MALLSVDTDGVRAELMRDSKDCILVYISWKIFRELAIGGGTGLGVRGWMLCLGVDKTVGAFVRVLAVFVYTLPLAGVGESLARCPSRTEESSVPRRRATGGNRLSDRPDSREMRPSMLACFLAIFLLLSMARSSSLSSSREEGGRGLVAVPGLLADQQPALCAQAADLPQPE